MFYFVSPFRVSLLLWTLLITSTSSDKNRESNSDADMVLSFIEKIIKPYIDGNAPHFKEKARLRTEEHTVYTEIKEVIRLKVIQLKPFLQDSEYNRRQTKTETDDNLNFEEKDKTVILDLVPEKLRRTKVKLAVKENKKMTQSFKEIIATYKEIRNHITILLEKENTSNLTNTLITTTLDEMLALLIKKQCKWKSVYTGDLMKHFDKSSRKSMQKLKNKSRVLDQYRLACYLEPKDKGGDPDRYFRLGHPSLNTSSKGVDLENSVKDQNQCDTLIICSDELRDFLTITFNYLNDTAVATFTNYIAMFARDVKMKTKPSHNIVTTKLEDLSNYAEKEVKKIFINELEHLTLDENKNKTANNQHIKSFIEATTSQIKNRLSMLVNDHLNSMNVKAKLFLTIKDDLIVNLRMDMDQLNQLIADKICGFFILCNGIGTRRFNKPGDFTPKELDNVYFKAQLSFDDEMKGALARNGNQKLNSWPGEIMSIYSFGKSLMDTIGRKKFNYKKVSRTSAASTATTKSIASNEDMRKEQFF